METWDLGTSSMGRGDAGASKTGTQGIRDVNDYRKSRREMRYLFLRENVLFMSTLDSIFQNHIGHLMMFTQNISLY